MLVCSVACEAFNGIQTVADQMEAIPATGIPINVLSQKVNSHVESATICVLHGQASSQLVSKRLVQWT